MTSLQSILARAEDRATNRISEIDHRVAGLLTESCLLGNEREELSRFLTDFRRRDRSLLESLFADEASIVAEEIEPAPPAPPVVVKEVPAAPDAPVVPEQPAPVAPVEKAAPPAIPTKAEAHGLKDFDAAILIVMRGERQADGICRMSMTQIAKLAGVPQKTAAEQCVKRLRTAGIIMPTKDDPTIFHVADKGQRVPLVVPGPGKRAVVAPVAPPSALDAGLDAKLLDLIRRASETSKGPALFETKVLATRVDVSAFRLNVSLGRLAAAGKIKSLPSLAGHVTIELAGKKVAA